MKETFYTFWHLISGFVVFWAYLACLPFLAIGLWFVVSWGLHELGADSVEARVIAMEQMRPDESGWRPTFAITGVDGTQITYTDVFQSGSRKYDVGDPLVASYSPATGAIRIESELRKDLSAGLVFIVIGLASLFIVLRHRRFKKRMREFYTYPRS